MRFCITAVLFVALGASSSPVLADQTLPASLLQQAEAAYNRGDCPTALGIWAKGLALMGKSEPLDANVTILAESAVCYYHLQNADKARAAITRAQELVRSKNDPLATAIQDYKFADLLRRAGQSDDALTLYQAALVAFQTLHYLEGESLSLDGIGNIEMGAKRYDQAIVALNSEAQVDHERGLWDAENGDLFAVALAEDAFTRYDDARTIMARVASIYHQHDDRAQEAKALFNLGTIDTHLGHYESALADNQSALDLYRTLGDPSHAFDCLTRIVLADAQLDRYAEARAAAGDMVTIARSTNSKLAELDALNTLAKVNAPLGAPPEASLQAASDLLAYARVVKDTDLERSALADVASAEEGLGRYDDAWKDTEAAVALSHQSNDRDTEVSDIVSLATIEADLGRNTEALARLQTALSYYRDIKNRLAMSAILVTIGILEDRLERSADAIASVQEALNIARDLKSPSGQANALLELALFDDEAHHYDAALQKLQEQLSINRATKEPGGVALAQLNIAKVQADAGQYDEASQSIAASIESYRRMGFVANLWQALWISAVTNAQLTHQAEALRDFDAAVEAIESSRAKVGSEDRNAFISDKLRVYDDYIAYLEKLNAAQPGRGYDRKAMDILELKEARSLSEQIAGSLARRFKGIPDEIRTRDAQTQSALDAAQAAVDKLGSSGDSAQQAQLNLESARSARIAFEAVLRTTYPQYFALLHPKPNTVEELQKQTLHSDEALLSYEVLDGQTYLFVVTTDRFQSVVLPGADVIAAGLTRLRSHIDALVHSVENRSPKSVVAAQAAADMQPFAVDSGELYRTLIPAQIEPLLAQKKLIVVPTGPLYDFPFEALVTSATPTISHYLIEDYSISYIPSASLLSVVRESGPPHGQRLPLLAFADPTYDTGAEAPMRGATFETLKYGALRDAAGGAFHDLPGAKIEAAGVQAALRGGTVITGDDATKARLLAIDAAGQLSQYRYVLFATHAVLPHEVIGVVQPALVMAHPYPDDFVTSDDVLGLSLDADFVALSACNTGEGPRNPGEGISGMTRAFLYAGTPAISVTLWDVDDAAAAILTPAFFAGMSGRAPASDALRAAKLKLLRSADPALMHPYAWAPTVIFGDGNR